MPSVLKALRSKGKGFNTEDTESHREGLILAISFYCYDIWALPWSDDSLFRVSKP
jgi:hypothetical protein